MGWSFLYFLIQKQQDFIKQVWLKTDSSLNAILKSVKSVEISHKIISKIKF